MKGKKTTANRMGKGTGKKGWENSLGPGAGWGWGCDMMSMEDVLLRVCFNLGHNAFFS